MSLHYLLEFYSKTTLYFIQNFSLISLKIKNSPLQNKYLNKLIIHDHRLYQSIALAYR